MGISACEFSGIVREADHPHARGDFSCSAMELPRFHGPSPRAWGFRLTHFRHGIVERTIPTRVGISTHSRYRCDSVPVHPHARGDFTRIRLSSPTSLGPSPRAWGFPHHLPEDAGRDRSIPTRVGISSRADSRCIPFPVHPHARGDFGGTSGTSSADHGPSPRAWGFHGLVGRSHYRLAVHPHARGDFESDGRPDASNGGPSPRAWGFLEISTQVRRRHRSIPTRVGISHPETGWPRPWRSIPTRVGISRCRSWPAPWAGPSPRAWGFQQE